MGYAVERHTPALLIVLQRFPCELQIGDQELVGQVQGEMDLGGQVRTDRILAASKRQGAYTVVQRLELVDDQFRGWDVWQGDHGLGK